MTTVEELYQSLITELGLPEDVPDALLMQIAADRKVEVPATLAVGSKRSVVKLIDLD